MVSVIHRWSLTSRSSRAGSGPAATRTARRWSRGLPGGRLPRWTGGSGPGAGARSDRGDGAAAAATGPPGLAAVPPWLTGGPGDLTRPGPPADAAGQPRARAAALAPRPVRRACRDPAAAPAADTVLQVGRVV